MTLLAVRHLRKSFGGNRAVADVSFTVAAGEVVGLIGPNGAGKSTCFNILNGQLRADAGQVVFDSARIDGWDAQRIWRAGVGRGFQVAAVFGSMTVLENVRTALLSRQRQTWRFFRPARRCLTQEARALLQQVGLTHLAEQGCATLAYGDLKRVELALAMANAPRLLLMDEPTAGMTLADRRSVMDLLLLVVRRTNCAVLLTEHDTDAVFRIADRVLVMDRGVLIAQGSPAVVKADPAVQAAYLGT